MIIKLTEDFSIGDRVTFDANARGVHPRITTGTIIFKGRTVAMHGFPAEDTYTVKLDNGSTVTIGNFEIEAAGEKTVSETIHNTRFKVVENSTTTLNDVDDVFVNDIFVNSKGIRLKVKKVNSKDFTVLNLDTNIVSRIEKNYLIQNFELEDDLGIFSEKISQNDYSNATKGTAYKVFRLKNGKLYPPMVANPGGEDTPVGVWLDAEEGEFAGLSKTGRKKVKSTGSGDLAYRPGWHLGDVPRAKQFDRSFSWVPVSDVDELEVEKTVSTMKSFISTCAKASNIGKIYFVKDVNTYFEVVDDKAPYFPYDFVWAECEYLMDVNYQDEADEQGYMRTKPDGSTYKSDKYQHSLAGLPKIPERGYYKYRTNPNPDTVPWVITGAIKVTKLLDDFDVARVLGGSAPERQGGNKTLDELGLTQI